MDGNTFSHSRVFKNIVLLLAITVSGLSFAQKGGGVGIEFDSTLMPSERLMIIHDLNHLTNLRRDSFVFVDSQNQSKDLQALQDNPSRWLLSRISILVGPLNRSYYLNTSTNAITRNLGAALAKTSIHTVHVNERDIDVKSADVGIIQFNKNPSEILLNKTKPAKALVNSLYRLGLLFHDARHSDGQNGIPQINCPKGVAYAGLPLCDRYVDGAFGVEAFIGQALINQNKANLDVADLALLNNWIARTKQHIIGTEIYAK